MEYSTSTDIKSYTAIIGEQWAMMSDNRCTAVAVAAAAWSSSTSRRERVRRADETPTENC